LKPPPPLKRIHDSDQTTPPPNNGDDDGDEEMTLPGEAVTAMLEDEENEEDEDIILSEDESADGAGELVEGAEAGTRGPQRIYCDDTTKFCQVRCKLCEKLMAYDGILGTYQTYCKQKEIWFGPVVSISIPNLIPPPSHVHLPASLYFLTNILLIVLPLIFLLDSFHLIVYLLFFEVHRTLIVFPGMVPVVKAHLPDSRLINLRTGMNKPD
jgi:hypothetical protein